MRHPRQRDSQWNCLALAFAFPCGAMLLVMLASKYAPFGDYSILYSDMYHQYYPFFVAFRNALRSGESLLYSWQVGMGMDYLGLISYYLASPLNLLSVLVPEGWLISYFSLMMPIKLGLAGLFFGIFLKGIFRRSDISVSVFSTFYALCAWALGYQWNIMWLDTFALLPLVVLGMVALLRDRKFILYTFSLFLCVFANYYVGFFVCIFVFLLFFVYEICRGQGGKRFFQDLCRIAFFSVLAIGMTAILELPAFAALQNTQSSVNQFPQGFKMNIATENTWKGLLDAMRQVAGNMGSGIVPTFKEGLPNVSCGVISIMLGILYLLNKEVKLRDKLCAVGLLLFFMLSFILRQLDYIWHGFHFPNMIPYRFSFLFSFVLLYMAYKAWTLREHFRLSHIFLAMGITSAIFSCSNLMRQFNPEDSKCLIFLIGNLSLLMLYGIILICGQMKKALPADADQRMIDNQKAAVARRWKNAQTAVSLVMAAEITLTMVVFGLNFGGTSIAWYPRGGEYTASVIRYMHEREEGKPFFRAETTHSQTLNDGALNNYNGISAFTSSANVKVTEFLQDLGYGAKNTYNRYCYEEASPVSDLFLNLKYMIERSGRNRESSFFTAINTFDQSILLQNNYHLPLGFLTEPELAELEFVTEGFRFQNQLLTAASGLDGNVWITLTNPDILGTDVTITTSNSAGYAEYEKGLKNSTISYTYRIVSEGFMCIDVNLPKRNDVAILLNGVELYNETTSLRQQMAVGDVCPGDTVEIRLTCKSDNESGTATVSAAILDMDQFLRAYQVLSASTLEVTEFSNTRVSGTITCDRDGLLYTSIPQDGNWSVQVDGREAGIILVGDAMCAVSLDAGDHTVDFTYHNEAFSLGLKISLVCAGLFLVLSLVHLRRRPSGKYARKGNRKNP